MGVKSLWQLLDPVGRPVLLETMEGKAMAIDSSIWIYQFQATMRDKEGRGLVNAHVVGFLRRICKLLFYGIKPVFVFDGGAPALKMATIAERKQKKSGAAASHAKVAERLLAAQMRREALESAIGRNSDAKGKGKAPPHRIDDNTVYLEDLTGSAPKTPAKPAQSEGTQQTPPSSSKKPRWRDHDPYRLPDVNMDAAIAKATAAAVPDPRLATEEELRTFIEEMRPEDFDVSSPAFRELPTEMQYEIIGDLRLKSRQTSYKRLQSMLKVSKTPLDFSKEQIKNLKQRNALTQQLLVTTDSIGQAHLTIPVRIASERNKEYVLVKNEGADGGWVLGIRDEGTAAKPIEIDPVPAKVEISEDEDDDMEDVPIAPPAASAIDALYDPDLREFRRGQALSALAARYTPNGLAPLTTKTTKKQKKQPLFAPEEDELPQLDNSEEGEDVELAFALEESARMEEDASLLRATEESRLAAATTSTLVKNGESSSSGAGNAQHSPDKRRSQQFHTVSDESDEDDLYASPTRLETALSIAGAGPRRPPPSKSSRPTIFPSSSTFGVPTLLMASEEPAPSAPEASILVPDSDEDEMEEVTVPVESTQPIRSEERSPRSPSVSLEPVATKETIVISEDPMDEDEDDDMEVVEVPEPTNTRPTPSGLSTDQALANDAVSITLGPQSPSPNEVSPVPDSRPASRTAMSGPVSPLPLPPVTTTNTSLSTPSRSKSSSRSPDPAVASSSAIHLGDAVAVINSDAEEDDPDQIPWSRSPSPASKAADTADASGSTRDTAEGWDAAQEIDPHAEEDEYTRFISQVKGKDIDTVRREIDEEIKELNKQKKSAMRDSEDITQQMISQIMIMLRLFGIPYITAPMEAEAQCAALLTLGLVDGIITDDSDVFLFGGARVLKNMFNQSKTVECFLAPDLARELGLDRGALVRLAYLLGSDYTAGLPGVGPVVAMELLQEFPGEDGLHRFKAWWTRVQSGRDAPGESGSKFRKRFKKKFKDLYLAGEWPNAAVRDAYYHPTVDESTEPFKWGMPDLDALRGFFQAELGWDQPKVDELLLPIIRKMSRRAQGAATVGQGMLAGFFDAPLGASAAPRRRQAYASKRLQQVVADFRKQQQRQGQGHVGGRDGVSSGSEETGAGEGSDGEREGEGEEEARPAKKRKKGSETKAVGRGKGRGWGKAVDGASRGRGTGRGRGRGRGGKRTSKKRGRTPSDSEDEDAFGPGGEEGGNQDVVGADVPAPSREELGLRPRPKPRPVVKPRRVEEGQEGEGDDAG